MHRSPAPGPWLRSCLGAVLLTTLALAQPVDVTKVIARNVERTVQLPGEFLPYESVAIHAKVTGFVDRVEVDRGSFVRNGQLLATLVAPELKAQTAEAEAKVQAAESNRAEAEARVVAAQSTYDRLKNASATPGAIAGNELIQAEKAVDAARAQVRAAEASVSAARASAAAVKDMESYLNVTAPFSGVITERNVHPGALVGPAGRENAVPMFRLEQNNRLRLVVSVPEIEVSGISRGTRASFTVPAHPGETFTGVVARIPRSMDPKTRSMAVELDVANARGALAPGMYATITWPVSRRGPSLLVPASSVVTTTEKTFVIRVRDGAAEWVTVRRVPGAPQGELIEVYGPLREGDLIVKRGTDEIREGARLNVRPVKPS
jgi:membrane fusion protein (multidrug efflux system)